MKWLNSLFGRRDTTKDSYTSRRVTSKEPLVVQDPKIGFLNLMGLAARPLIDEDATALGPLFSGCVESEGRIPACDVLMIYARIQPDGTLQNAADSLQEIILKSHAPIVIVATENDVQSYIAAGKRSGPGRANLVMTLNRKGQMFPAFFWELFTTMHQGVTMPMAWVKLAPQVPGMDQPNVPATICAMQVTHVLFRKS